MAQDVHAHLQHLIETGVIKKAPHKPIDWVKVKQKAKDHFKNK